MRKYKVLALTDHSRHSDQNSIYALLNTLRTHEQCQDIYVSSRGVVENASFYQECEATGLNGVLVGDDFRYTDDGICFTERLKSLNPLDFDLILMRLPRPVSDDFLQWLRVTFSHAVMINDPLGVIETSSKEFLLHFPLLCPAMRLCRSSEEILAFGAERDIVLKPLREYGGKGLVKISNGTVDDGVSMMPLSEFLRQQEEYITRDGYLAMEYLHNVSAGDKRIIVVDGEVMACSLRLPTDGSWLCNVAQGGRSVAAQITDEELHIVEQVNPLLRAKGIIIYGIDTLTNDEGKRVLSEINTLSIGGFPQAEQQMKKPVLMNSINRIINYTNENYE